MLHLAIECSGFAGSVALCHQQRLLAERELPAELGSVRTLAAHIAELIEPHPGGDGAGVQLISVTCGPGSFTGLRVGLATAQMLAYAWRIRVACVDTLEAIAWGVAQATRAQAIPTEAIPTEAADEVLSTGAARAADAPLLIVPVVNAFRKQVFAAAWRYAPAGNQPLWQQLAAAQVIGAAQWQAAPLHSLSAAPATAAGLAAPTLTATGLEPIVVCGPGLQSYLPHPTPPVALAEQRLWQPKAASIAELGWEKFRRGQVVAADQVRPNYVRPSAAEEHSP